MSDNLVKDKLSTVKAVIALVFYTTVNVPKLEPVPNLEHQQIFVNEIKYTKYTTVVALIHYSWVVSIGLYS